jgi:hypothetical protein
MDTTHLPYGFNVAAGAVIERGGEFHQGKMSGHGFSAMTRADDSEAGWIVH